MRSWILVAISLGLLLASILLSLYYGFFFLFLFLPIGLLWSAFRRGGNRSQERATTRGYGGEMYCSNCGARLAENTNYCPICGEPIRQY